MAAGGNSVLTTFSQADVAAGRVVFQHDENSLAARFSLVLSDGRNESGVMSIEIAVRERGFDAGSMPTEPPPDRMPASSSLVVSGIEPADPMRERTQQAQASQRSCVRRCCAGWPRARAAVPVRPSWWPVT